MTQSIHSNWRRNKRAVLYRDDEKAALKDRLRANPALGDTMTPEKKQEIENYCAFPSRGPRDNGGHFKAWHLSKSGMYYAGDVSSDKSPFQSFYYGGETVREPLYYVPATASYDGDEVSLKEKRHLMGDDVFVAMQEDIMRGGDILPRQCLDAGLTFYKLKPSALDDTPSDNLAAPVSPSREAVQPMARQLRLKAA
jgi:hypothetical protein